jgi:hypothetical protein
VTVVTFSFLRWFLCSFHVLCVLETIIQNNYTGLFARVRIGHESFAFSITDVSGRVRPFVQKQEMNKIRSRENNIDEQGCEHKTLSVLVLLLTTKTNNSR